MQHLKTPVDLITPTCLSGSLVEQAIDTAQPFPNQGMILWASSAPDVVTNPELSDFIWGYQVDMSDDTTRTKQIYYYNGTSWELIPLEVLAGSLTLDRISLAGANIFDILQVTAGPNLVWTSIVAAIQNNTIPPIKLAVPNNTDNFVLTAFAGVKAFTEMVAFFNAIENNIIPENKLAKAAANALKYWLSTKADGSAIEWALLDLGNIDAAGAGALQIPRRNAGNTAWEYFTPVGTRFLPTPVDIVTLAAPSAWTTHDLAAFGVPITAKSVLLFMNGIASQVAGGSVSVEYTTSLRPASGGPELDTLIASAGTISGTANASRVTGQFWCPVDVVGAAVNIDIQLVKTATGGVTETINEVIKLVGYYA